MYQDSMPGAPPRIPVEPPEPQPSGLYVANFPPIPYNPAPPYTGTQATCPYIPLHVPDNGYAEGAMPAEVSDDFRGVTAAVTPTYSANVAVLDTGGVAGQIATPAADSEDSRPSPIDPAVLPQLQAAGIDQIPVDLYYLDVTNG